MIIAKDFVFVHLSKTGGTFAAETLRALFCGSAAGRFIHKMKHRHGLAVPFYPYGWDEGEQHAVCNEIPEPHRSTKTIVSIMRNPFDLYVSEYTFKWWIKYADLWFQDRALIEREYPNWREFTFDQFMDVSMKQATWVQKALSKYPATARLGWYSHKFVHYYCKNQDYVFQVADNFDKFVKRVQESMYPVHFLHTERLNKDLHEFLLSKGYPKDEIAHIPAKDKVNTSRKDYDYRKWYSDKLREEIKERDALIFHLFPEYSF